MKLVFRVLHSDLFRLAKFLAPLAFTEIVADIGEQVSVFAHYQPHPLTDSYLNRLHVILASRPTSFSIEV